MTSYR
jgi:hypothetical protein